MKIGPVRVLVHHGLVFVPVRVHQRRRLAVIVRVVPVVVLVCVGVRERRVGVRVAVPGGEYQAD